MADTSVAITAGTGTAIDTRTEATNGNHRQVVVIGDPSVNAGVAPVDATNGLSVNVTNASLTVASHAVTNAGTFAVQAAQSGTWNVGTVTTVTGVTTVSTVTAVTAITNALPAGSNLLGKVDVQFAGTAPDLGSGTGGSKTQRVIIDSSQLSAVGQTTMSGSTPVVIASNQTAFPVTTAITATSNGGTASRINAAASTNATSLKASAGQIYTIDVFNVAAYNVFLKLYNKASAPTVGTDTPVMTIPVPAGGGFSKTWPMGFPFATGIAYAITKLQADSDTTAVAALDLTGNTLWI